MDIEPHIFQACDTDSKGFLTASDLNAALEKVLKEDDKMEVMKIIGVLDSDQAKVSLTLFQQKVMEFARGRQMDESEAEADVFDNNNREIQNIVLAHNKNLEMREGRDIPFHPTRFSSPLLTSGSSQKSARTSILEETFESHGDVEDMSPFSDRDDELSFSRGSRLRVTLRGSRRRCFRRHSASSSDTPSPVDLLSDTDNIEFLSSNLHTAHKLDRKDLRAISRQLQQRNEIIERYEEELLNESNLVKSLEERLSCLETTNKEISHQLDNSKVNIKNLETHMIFLEEKNSNEAREVERQRVQLMTERDKLHDERSQILLREFQLQEKMEEFESWRAEISARNHILQTEILNLIKEKKKTDENYNNLENVLRNKINKLLLENISLKQQLVSGPTDSTEQLTTTKKEHRPSKRRKIPKQLKINHLLELIMEENLPKLYIHAILTCLFELISCLLTH